MAFNKEVFEALVDREGIQDFIWAKTWTDIPDTEVGIFELDNDRYGTIFKIYPPFYASLKTETKLSTFFKLGLPEKTSIQLFMYASKNIQKYLNAYKATHSTPGKIDHLEVISELRDVQTDFLDKHTEKSIFENRGMDFRIRDFVNLCIVTIPRFNEYGTELSRSEVINTFSRVASGLSDFEPTKFTQEEYVALMREILNPDAKGTWNVDRDHRTYINDQVADVSTVISLSETDGTLGIGKAVTKEEYDRQQNSVADNRVETKKSFSQQIKNMFKKKEEVAERETYTNYFSKVYTTKTYPRYNSLFEMLNNFVDFYGTQIETEIPCSYFSSLTVYIENKESAKKEVLEKTQWNLWQTESLGTAVRYFPAIKERAIESEEINQMISDGSIPMQAMWSLGIIDNSENNVLKYGERIRKKFLEKNWLLQEETVIPHIIFLYSLPMQFEEVVLMKFSKRMNTLFTENCATIAPIMTGEKGFGLPILSYVDRAGQIAGVDLFSSDSNYNFIVVGTSGSGKSYAMADLFFNYLMNGTKIRIIDVGRSYKDLCDTVGGQYIEFTEESNICLNFFTHIGLNDEGRIHDDEMQTIVPLIGLMAMQSLDPEMANNNLDVPVVAGYISAAVTMAFEDRHRSAGMQDVVISLEKLKQEQKNEGTVDPVLSSLIIALNSFGDPRGEYFKYFNGQNNLKFKSDFVVLELDDIDSKKHLKSVVLATVAHMIHNEFFLGDRSQRKILAVDEAWSIVKNKVIMEFLENMARRIRKYKGGLGIITQKMGDFFENSATKAIFDTSATKIFLKQNQESLAAAEANGELTLDKGIIHLMKTLSSKPPMFSEIMFKQDSEAFIIARLITNRVSHWVYTNHPKDMEQVAKIQKEFNVSVLDAKMIKGYSEYRGTSLEEEYNRRIQEGRLLSIGEEVS